MLRESFRLFQRYYRVVDAVWIGLAWVIAYWVRFTTGLIPVYFGVPPFGAYVAHLPLVLLVWMALRLSTVVVPWPGTEARSVDRSNSHEVQRH